MSYVLHFTELTWHMTMHFIFLMSSMNIVPCGFNSMLLVALSKQQRKDLLPPLGKNLLDTWKITIICIFNHLFCKLNIPHILEQFLMELSLQTWSEGPIHAFYVLLCPTSMFFQHCTGWHSKMILITHTKSMLWHSGYY